MSGFLRPPFIALTATAFVHAVEDGWRQQDDERVAGYFSARASWRDRDAFLCGREAIRAHLRRRWALELDARTHLDPWAWSGSRIAVRLEAEWRDPRGSWFRTHGIHLWHVDEEGLVIDCQINANDIPIDPSERRLPTRSTPTTRIP